VELSKRVKERIEALSQDFSQNLPVRFGELERSLQQLTTRSTIEHLQAFRLLLHKLGGSAATFGFEQLSQRSKEFERYIDTILAADKVPDEEELQRMEEFLEYIRAGVNEPEGDGSIAELEEIVEQDGQEAPGTHAEAEEAGGFYSDREKNLYLYGFPKKLQDETAKQVGYYGYHAEAVSSSQEIADSLLKGNYLLTFVYMPLFRTSPKEEQRLTELKHQYSDELSLVYVSDEDTFDRRLRAIRAGGDAFLVMPLDIGWLIDKLDALWQDRPKEPYHILIVDDDQEQVAYYAMLLQQAGMITSVASDPLKVLSILVESKPDMILMDLYMPWCSGLELVQLLRQHEVFIAMPIIFLSYENDPQVRMEAVRKGGDDFFTKPIDPQYLISVVEARVARTRSMRFFMERDSLTGLLNHSNLKEQLARELHRADRIGMPISFAMIDTDLFKQVNDTFGHLTGDRVLKSLARLLQDRLRRSDIVGRYGGEEFGVILLNATVQDAKGIMEEIRKSFSQVVHKAKDKEFYVTFSCGIASYPEFDTAEKLSEAADELMYAAKEAGRNRVMTTDERRSTDTGAE